MALAHIKFDAYSEMWYLESTVGVKVYFLTKEDAEKYRSMMDAPGGYRINNKKGA